MGVNDKAAQIPFAELVRQTSLAVADGQLALDQNSVLTAQVLAETMFPKDSVIIAIVETVDADGQITKVDLLKNDEELSLLAWGLYPTFYNFAETTIDMRFSAFMYLRESSRATQSQFTRDYASRVRATTKKYGGGGGLSLNLGIFKIGGSGGYQKTERETQYESSLMVSSATSSASSMKYEGESIYCRMQILLKPKDAPDRLVPQVIRKEEPGGGG
jgi:hypothetical protein